MSIKPKYLMPAAPLLLIVLMIVFFEPILHRIGRFVIMESTPVQSDAVVVLNTGLEVYPRLIQAAALYRQGLVDKVVINGNRKTDSLRRLEAEGFHRSCPWYADSVKILKMKGVPSTDVIAISAEDAYDTITEARAVGNELLRRNYAKLLITTSKFHSRRAYHIWRHLFGSRLTIGMVAAGTDPYQPAGWWREGRQIRWVLAEYGAWLFYWYNRTTNSGSMK